MYVMLAHMDEHTEHEFHCFYYLSYSSYIKMAANCTSGNKECVQDGGKETPWKQAI